MRDFKTLTIWNEGIKIVEHVYKIVNLDILANDIVKLQKQINSLKQKITS